MLLTTEICEAQLNNSARLEEISVEGQGSRTGLSGALVDGVPAPYSGGQVAHGGQVGLLGNKDFMETPFSVASYTDKTIRDQQANSVAEVLTNSDPSVRAAIGAGNRYDAITIRGFRVDNVEFALNGLYGLVPDFRINPANVSRIELLKGPATFLYGVPLFGSVGGTVNVVTKRPADEPLTRVTTEYVSDARFGSQVDVSRRYGDQGQIGVRINGSILGGRAPYDGQDQLNGLGSISLDYRGDRLRLFADVMYQSDRYDRPTRGYLPSTGIVIPKAPDPRINLSQTFDFSDAKSLTVLGRAEYDLTQDVMLYGAIGTNQFSYRKQETPGATIINSIGDARSFSRLQEGDSSSISGEVGARAKFSTGGISHELVVSASSIDKDATLGQVTYGNYLTNIYNPTLLLSAGAPVAATTFPRGRSSYLNLNSVAVSDTLSVYDGLLQLIVGGRYVRIENGNYAPRTGALTTSYDQDATTPSVALVVRPTKTLSFYANYIEGFTAASPPPDGSLNTNQVFAPIRTKQYEVGTKVDFGSFGATLSAFEIALPTGLVDPITQIYSISGEQRNRGFEATIFGEIAPGLRLLGGATFVDGRLTKTAGGINNGNEAVGVPRFQSTMGLEWDVPYATGLTAIARVTYTGETYADAANKMPVPDWTVVDLGLRYTTRAFQTPMTFRAAVTNVADARYWTTNPTGYLISGAPRTFWLSASADF